MMLTISHTIQVTSFGGSATTTLLNWLVENNQNVGIDTRWKHQLCPPRKSVYNIPENYKPLYLIGDPVSSVISIFRRKIQASHARNMRCSENLKDWTIEDYIDRNLDLFHIDKQLKNWTKPTDSYNILCVKYHSIWNHVDDILNYWNLQHLKESFPHKKDRNNTSLNKHRERLSQMYKSTNEYIDSLPDCFIL